MWKIDFIIPAIPERGISVSIAYRCPWGCRCEDSCFREKRLRCLYRGICRAWARFSGDQRLFLHAGPGEHLYFMLGDFNTKLFFSSSDKSPRGYMAEARHLAELRGYDNILRDGEGKPIYVDLYSDEYSPGIYFAADSQISRTIVLRNYSDLIPYLKAGINSEKITRLNNREEHFWESGNVEPEDIQMTIDAILQTKLQQRIS